MSPKKSSKKSSAKKAKIINPQVGVPAPRSSENFFNDFHAMQQRMDALFNHFWEAPFFSPLSTDVFRERSFPAWRDFSLSSPSSVWENEKELGLSVELPGLDKKDIQLNITPHLVEIRAEKKHEQSRGGKDIQSWERAHTSFYRSFPLPSHADSSRAQAKFENGVLRITIPKTKSLPPDSRKLEIE